MEALSGRVERDSQHVAVMFVTANVGTLFEMADVMMDAWLDEFIMELGGKKASEQSMEQTNRFVRQLLERKELADYDRARFFLDEEFRNTDSFTALGSLYFAHKSLADVKMWDFHLGDYVNVVGTQISLLNNSASVPVPGASLITKLRFPLNLHPLAKGNRKGFARTRWKIEGRVMDLVNIHLFYDEDNLVAMEAAPSQYTDARRWGLQYAIDSVQLGRPEALFVFGDFNFRLDVHDVVKTLTKDGIRQECFSTDDDPTQLQSSKARVCFVENNHLQKLILTVEKKTFDHHDSHDYVFQLDNGKWLRTFDNELVNFGSDITEMEINFPPSYPYLEEMDKGRFFMKTRCPAWCDRVIMNRVGRNLIDTSLELQHDLIGPAVCMGDHKPVFLFCHLHSPSVPSAAPVGKVISSSPRAAESILGAVLKEEKVTITHKSTNDRAHHSDMHRKSNGNPPNLSRKSRNGMTPLAGMDRVETLAQAPVFR